MPLARIISSSRQCSRELALGLLERGYTVEIVSPDAIPDNFADLELRVDASASDLLTANVTAREGERSASLDFVHQLRAAQKAPANVPMPDFRQHSEDATDLPLASPRLSIVEADPAFEVDRPVAEVPSEALLLPAIEPKRASRWAFTPPEILFRPISLARPKAAINRSLESLHRSFELLAQRSKSAIQHAVPARTIRLKWVSHAKANSKRWFGRATAAFAGLLAVALAVGSGLHYRGSSPVPGADASVQASNLFDLSAQQLPNTAGVPEAPKHDEKVGPATGGQRSNVRPKHPAIVNPPHVHGDDLVAANTIRYLDQLEAKPIPVRTSSRHHRRSHRTGDVVAASKVTHLKHRAKWRK
jgi:hypothetical protein